MNLVDIAQKTENLPARQTRGNHGAADLLALVLEDGSARILTFETMLLLLAARSNLKYAQKKNLERYGKIVIVQRGLSLYVMIP